MKWASAVAVSFFTFSCVGEVEVVIEGTGAVEAGAHRCEASCQIAARGPLTLKATAANEWSFAGWSGACSGLNECRVDPGGRVTATFARVPVEVTVRGEGSVVASDGRTCDSTCSWLAPDGVTLRGEANPGSVFLGFRGRCAGSVPCFVTSGPVEAIFARLEAVRVEFEGDGEGTVLVGEEACTEDCEVLVRPGTLVTISAMSGPSTLTARVTEGCAVLPCAVTPPALVRVEFEVGRRVAATIDGPGQVEFDGQSWCSTGRCERLASRDAGFTLSAIAGADEFSFFGFDGGNCSESPCVVGPGNDDLEVSARFASSILWIRSFEVEGGDTVWPSLFADQHGLIMTASAGGQMIIDGVTHAAPVDADQIFVVAVEMNWMGATKWVRPFNDYQRNDGNQNASIDAIFRADGGVLLGGSCQGNGRFNGVLDCGLLSLITVSLDSTGQVQAFHGESVPGTFPVAFMGQFAHLQGRVVTSQFVRLPRSGAFGFVDALDTSIMPVFTVPELWADWGDTECVPTGQHTLLCILRREGALTLDSCTVPAGAANRNEPVMLEFDGELRCIRGRRFTGGTALQIGGLSKVAADGSILFHGINTPILDLGDGHTAMVPGSFVAEWRNGVVSRLAHQPDLDPGPMQVERWREGVIIENGFNPGSNVRGMPAATYGVELTFLADDWLTPVRRWRFDDLQPSMVSNLTPTRFYVEGNRVAIVVEGVDVRFNGTPLVTNGRRMAHLVVLKP